jgi:hypothetical protein
MLPAGIWRTDRGADWERAQARQGIKLDDQHYLRRFPCWPDFRGNLGVQLSQALALSSAARLRRDAGLLGLAETQLHWALGRNPFAQSLMYGVGHDYAPQYTAMSGDMTGTLPVGIQSRGEGDEPYWPVANCYNYAEVWVHPGSRWLAIMADLAAGVPTAPPSFSLEASPVSAEEIEVRLAAERQHGAVELRGFNLEIPPDRTRTVIESGTGEAVRRTFRFRVLDDAVLWCVVAFPAGRLSERQESLGGLPQGR